MHMQIGRNVQQCRDLVRCTLAAHAKLDEPGVEVSLVQQVEPELTAPDLSEGHEPAQAIEHRTHGRGCQTRSEAAHWLAQTGVEVFFWPPAAAPDRKAARN